MLEYIFGRRGNVPMLDGFLDFAGFQALGADFDLLFLAFDERVDCLYIGAEAAQGLSGYPLADTALTFCHTSAGDRPAADGFFAAYITFPCHFLTSLL